MRRKYTGLKLFTEGTGAPRKVGRGNGTFCMLMNAWRKPGGKYLK